MRAFRSRRLASRAPASVCHTCVGSAAEVAAVDDKELDGDVEDVEVDDTRASRPYRAMRFVFAFSFVG